MRLMISMLGLVAGAATLGACGGGDRASVMAATQSECETKMSKSGMPATIDGARLCSCLVTRLSEGKTAEQVKEIFAKSEPPADAAPIMMQCTTEAMQAAK